MALPPIDDAEYVWFRKTFDGLFWRPVSLEGWIVTIIWVLSNVWYFRTLDLSGKPFGDVVIDFGFFGIISTLILLAIVRMSNGRRWE